MNANNPNGGALSIPNLRIPVPSPAVFISADEKARLLNLDSQIKSKIIGQDEAVSVICHAIRRNSVGFKAPNRPIASFIFLGTTGIGKTALCRALAEVMYGDEKRLIKVDMSEYSTQWDVSKLTGAAPGYVGFGEGIQLTNLVMQNPYSVVCFDEIEKAHPDIFNVLLQITEDAVLTSGKGERADFSNCVVIMTSNLGSDSTNGSTKPIGFIDNYDEEADKNDKIKAALKQTFRPEFLNRIDEVITFNRLDKKHVLKICNIMLKKVQERAQMLNIQVKFDRNVASELIKIGYNKKYGARPLRRAISAQIEDMLATKFLEGELNYGDKIHIIFDKNSFVIDKKESVILPTVIEENDEDGMW